MTVSSLNFAPEWSTISSVTRGSTTVVTFTAAHDFVVGQTVSFVVENEYGMRQLNGLLAPVTAVGATTITVPINSLNFTPFTAPGSPVSIAQCIPVGSANWGFTTQGTVPNGTEIGPSGAFRIP